MSSEIIVETILTTKEPEVKGKVEKRGGKRIGYNYIILKSLKESPKNDVVKCIYIKSFTNFGLCVIKEGTAGELKDKHDRDIKDRLVWQKELHELLQDKVRIPKLIGSFEENGNYYLAIEHIKGITLGSFCKKYGDKLRQGLITGNRLGLRSLGYLLEIINLLDTLHKNHIVHRDVTSANFIITPGGKVAVIDMELSYSIQKQMPMPPFMLGTHGYMSPEQLAVASPTIKEDIFSVGAILLQAWANIAPSRLTQAPLDELEGKSAFFIPDKEIANIVLQCLHPDAQSRPTLMTVYQVLEKYKYDLKKRVKREKQSPPFLSKGKIKEAIQQTINTLGSSLLADRERGWFADNNNIDSAKEKDKMNKAWYASFHLGGTGVLYLLSRAHLSGLDVEITRPHIHHILSLIEKKYIDNFEIALPGLHFGADGIAACLSEALQYGLIEPSDKYQNWINSLLKKKTESIDIISGIAGQGMANLISIMANKKEVDARLEEQVDYLLSQQNEQGVWVRSGSNKDQKMRVTRGFAFGVAGIVHFLLEYTQQYNNKECLDGAQKGLEWLMRNSTRNKDVIEWRSSEGKNVSPSWHDGGPGIALAFIKAYEILKDPVYKSFASHALQYHPKKIFDGNVSQYNGLSGLGEIYLEAHQVLGDEQWMERAEWIAQLIMRLKKTHAKYGPYWQTDNEKQPVPGFMQGNAGTLHFLLRFCYPEKISFPMMPRKNDHQMLLGKNENLLVNNTLFT